MLDDTRTRWDGVTSIWYRQGPRSGSQRRRTQARQLSPAPSRHGAVVILSRGHEAKSSTMPYQQEYAFTSAGIPVLYPASVAQFREFGLHAIRLSRDTAAAGAAQAASALCDGGETVTFAPDDVPVRYQTCLSTGSRSPTTDSRSSRQEHRDGAPLYQDATSRCSPTPASTPQQGDPGRVAATPSGSSPPASRHEVAQALHDSAPTDAALDVAGVRILRMGLVYPLDEELVRVLRRRVGPVSVSRRSVDFLEQTSGPRCSRWAGRSNGVAKPTRTAGHCSLSPAGWMPTLSRCGWPGSWSGVRRGRDRRAGDPPREELELDRAREHVAAAGRNPNFCSGCPHSARRCSPRDRCLGAPDATASTR